jgi:uncharacterized protein (TIGR00251 family)
MPSWLRACEGGVVLDVFVQPRASRTAVRGEHGDRLKIQLAAPPVDGEANAELCRHLARVLEIPGRNVEIATGATGRRKSVRALGITLAAAASKLA